MFISWRTELEPASNSLQFLQQASLMIDLLVKMLHLRSFRIQRSQVFPFGRHPLLILQNHCQHIGAQSRDGTAAILCLWLRQPQSFHLSDILNASNFLPVGWAPQTACFPNQNSRKEHKTGQKIQLRFFTHYLWEMTIKISDTMKHRDGWTGGRMDGWMSWWMGRWID